MKAPLSKRIPGRSSERAIVVASVLGTYFLHRNQLLKAYRARVVKGLT